MDAKIKKVGITPMRFNKDGEIIAEEFATLTIDVPMDSAGQREGVIELLSLLSREWIQMSIEAKKSSSE